MGAITRAAANNITTGGIILPAGINDASVASISSLSGVSTSDGITLISSQTASGTSTVNFTSGINSTYRTYVFTFVNLHISTSSTALTWNASTDGGSNYNVSKQSTAFRAYNNEANTATNLGYETGYDLANGTGYQRLNAESGTDNDANSCGFLYLFNPSSTTYVKHFLSNCQTLQNAYSFNDFMSGYINNTSAVNAVSFSVTGGTIDDGTIYMYGIT